MERTQQGPSKRHALSPKRLRSACENCRKKKARCDSARPACGFCSRLGQICHYANPDSSIASSHTATSMQDLEILRSRITQLEATLPFSAPGDSSILCPELSINQTSAALTSGSWPYGIPQFSTCESGIYGKATMRSPLYGAELSQLNDLCDDNTRLSAGDINPHCLHQLLDAYFLHHHNQPYSFFHEGHLRQDVSLGLVPDHLLSAICAIAIRFITDREPQKRAALAFSRSSWASVSQLDMDTDGEFGLEVVQSLTLLAVFEYTEARQRGAWIKIGLASRLAQALDLHLEPLGTLPFWKQETRRRTFWTVYLFDKLSTCDRRKPPAIRNNICKVSLPCSEVLFKNGIAPERIGTIDCYVQSHVSGVPEPSPLARLMIVASVLSSCSQYVIQSSGTEVPPWDVRSQYQQVHSDLLYLETKLHFGRPVREAVERMPNRVPNSHEGAMIVISYAMYHVCYCLLSNTSHLRQRMLTSSIAPPLTFMRHAAEDNQTHAVELSKSLGYSSTTGIAARCSFLSYCAIVSAVLHAVNRNSGLRETRDQSEECLEVCSNFLAMNSAYWHNAGVMYNALLYFKSISSEFHYDASVFNEHNSRPTEMHAEIMAYLTDYGSLSGERGDEVITALSGGPSGELTRLAASGLPTQTGERAEGENSTRPDFDSTFVPARSGLEDLLDIGLPFSWPDAFGA